MAKKTWIYLGVFVLILSGFYGGLMLTTDFMGEKLPVLSNVRPFKFERHDGQWVTDRDVLGRVVVAEYFFTTCKGICPKMNRNMQDIHRSFRTHPDFLILSHTVDPETDSVPRLRRYADSLGADMDHWWFVTGSKAALYKSARESYLLDSQDNSSKNISDQFIHTQFFALVDREGQVRGIYDGLKKEEVDQLRTDIGLLLEGKVR
ncbi:MAG: SCO family protein [bacterium]|jgi:protein SCO1/2